ncbi:MAG: hypothetical protein NC320_11800 [Clostridium sp.]|nr:hypothetical protein [Clostridium sp.]
MSKIFLKTRRFFEGILTYGKENQRSLSGEFAEKTCAEPMWQVLNALERKDRFSGMKGKTKAAEIAPGRFSLLYLYDFWVDPKKSY